MYYLPAPQEGGDGDGDGLLDLGIPGYLLELVGLVACVGLVALASKKRVARRT
ncbi:MAG: hypothetical protein Kow0069_18270 [Promethearchaeota archaeon]